MADMHAASELKAYIDNDGRLYEQMTTSILKNLAAKKARGVYRHDLAVKGFGYLVEAGAKKYAHEFGSDSWHKMFDAATRKRVAEELTRSFEAAYALGNYEDFVPKKYQKQVKVAPSRRARKKSTHPDAKSLDSRVEILDSGDSKYFRPGQFGYVIGSTSRGGTHTLDRGTSREGDLTYLVSKRPKAAGGSALWFSDKALRFTNPGRGASGPVEGRVGAKSPKQIAREVEAVVGKVPSYRGR